MPFKEQQSDSCRCITLEGIVNISLANDLKRVLLDALETRQSLQIGMNEATDFDVSIVQLLIAAIRDWKRIEVNLEFLGPMRAELETALARAGFESFPVTIPVEVSLDKDVVVSCEV